MPRSQSRSRSPRSRRASHSGSYHSRRRRSRKSRSRSRDRARKSRRKYRSRSRSSGRRRRRSRSHPKKSVLKKESESNIKKEDGSGRVKEEKKRRKWDEAPSAKTTLAHMLPGTGGVAPNSSKTAVSSLLLSALHNPIFATLTSSGPDRRRDQIQRTVFVGNVLPHFTEAMLREFLDEKILNHPERPASLFPKAVFNITVKREKMYAFVEMHTQPDADIAVCMDGIDFSGTSMLIRRHSQYVEPDVPAKKYHITGVVSTTVENDANKVFIGPLDATLTDKDIKGFVGTFGPLKAFVLVKDMKTGEPKGYAFFSYADPAITDVACHGLNGIELCGKKVVCRRANINASRVAASLGLSDTSLKHEVLPSRILVLANIVPPISQCRKDPHMMGLKEQAVDRCCKFGTILDVQVTKDEVLVEFQDVVMAQKAASSLNGAMINGNVAISSFLAENEYKGKKIEAACAAIIRAEQPDPSPQLAITFDEDKKNTSDDLKTTGNFKKDIAINISDQSANERKFNTNIDRSQGSENTYAVNSSSRHSSTQIPQVTRTDIITSRTQHFRPTMPRRPQFQSFPAHHSNARNFPPFPSTHGTFRPRPNFRHQNLPQYRSDPNFNGRSGMPTNMNMNMNMRGRITGSTPSTRTTGSVAGRIRQGPNFNMNENINMHPSNQATARCSRGIGSRPGGIPLPMKNHGIPMNANMPLTRSVPHPRPLLRQNKTPEDKIKDLKALQNLFMQNRKPKSQTGMIPNEKMDRKSNNNTANETNNCNSI